MTKTACFGDWTEADVRKYEIMTGGAVPSGMQVQKGFSSGGGVKPQKCEKGSKSHGGPISQSTPLPAPPLLAPAL